MQLPEGGVRVQVHLTEEAWLKIVGPLDQRASVLFRRARRAKEVGTREQYLADALVDLISGPPTDGSGASSGSTTVVHGLRVDAAALRRGFLEPGEICELPGVGPVSVEAARQLIGDGIFEIFVRDGEDVTNITGHHHFVLRRLQAALQERDPICVVPECDADIALQIHHWEVDAAFGGPTRIENLCRICPVHHDLATHGGWKLRGGAGHWEWIAPAWPVSERLRQQRRRVVAGRAERARQRPDEGFLVGEPLGEAPGRSLGTDEGSIPVHPLPHAPQMFASCGQIDPGHT